MARTITKNKKIEEVELPKTTKPKMYRWRRISGKHHAMVDGKKVVILPGEIFLAPKNAFEGSRHLWELLGPETYEADEVTKVEEPKKPTIEFKKEQAKDGFNVLKYVDGEAVGILNDEPLTEKEADELIVENLDSK